MVFYHQILQPLQFLLVGANRALSSRWHREYRGGVIPALDSGGSVRSKCRDNVVVFSLPILPHVESCASNWENHKSVSTGENSGSLMEVTLTGAAGVSSLSIIIGVTTVRL